MHFGDKDGIIVIDVRFNNLGAIIGRKESIMEYRFVTECLYIGEGAATFNVRIMNDEGAPVGNANVIVNSNFECNSEFEEYIPLPPAVKYEAEFRCIVRAKFIFDKP